MFQFRSQLGRRALYLSKQSRGNGQYQLKIQDHAPWDLKQWFVFDRRTKSIRAAHNRSFTISREYGTKKFRPGNAVMRAFRNNIWQRTFYNKSKNIQDFGALVLTLNGWRNYNRNMVNWTWNKNHAGQRWTIDTKGIHIPRYPLKDGIRFQIKSRMSTNRALYYAEHIGYTSYRLRIRDTSPWDAKQWFVFDWRTKTVRAATDRRLVMSNQYGQKFIASRAANMRPFKNEPYQHILWYGGSRKNIRQYSGLCLDVHGNSNTNRRHTIFYKCHNGLNQAWYIDRKGVSYPPYPLRDGIKFQIKTRMTSHRALFYHEHIGGSQYRCRIRDNSPENMKQWWIFDSRTKTIRAYTKRNYALSNQRGTKFRINVAVVVRKYTGDITEKAKWFNGRYRNIRNVGRKCLSVHGNSDTHNRHVIYYNCNNGKSQQWYVDQRGISWPRQPLANGVKFQIRSKMSTGKALFHHTNNYGYIVNYQPWNPRTWWTFDSRTRTIRSTIKRTYVLSHRAGTGFKQKQHVQIRVYKGETYQKTAYWGGKYRNIRDVSGTCLDVHSGSNTNMRLVIFYRCHNGKNQGWTLDTKGVHFPRYPLRDGLRFQLKTMMKSKRALRYFEHIGGHQYRLRIQNNNPYDNKQWFVFDWRTRTIRAWGNRNMAISIQNGGNNWYYYHYAAVVRKFKSGYALQRIRWFNGSRRNIRDQGVRCLDVHGNSDSERRHVHWYKCHNGLNQGWTIDRKGFNYPKQPLKSGVRFQIRSRMKTHKTLFASEHIGSNQYRLRIHWHNPYDNNQWFVFDGRTQTIRSWKRRNFCMANRKGYKFRINVPVVIRPYTGINQDKIRWVSASRRNIQNNGKKCL